MSTVKLNYPTYKLFEPQYHSEGPIIIDADAIESPETVTLRYEEEAAAKANGGGLRGESPPGLLTIEACQKAERPPMHSFESPRPYQDPPYQYSGQPFATQQSENAAVAAAAQLNHMAFAANNTASQYMSSVVPTLTSFHPTSGVFGTQVVIKISAPYDLMAVTTHLFLAFGSQKSPARAVRDASDASGLGYVVSGEAPQLEDTRIPSGNVPISLLIESSDGQTLASIDVGTFTYHEAQTMGSEGPHENVTRRASPESAEEDQQQQRAASSPRHMKQEAGQLHDHEAAGAATNIYPYASTPHQAVASHYDAAGYTNTNTNSMLSTYQRPSYGADYPRPPSLLKGPSWAGAYGPSSLTSPRSPPNIHHHHHHHQQQHHQNHHQNHHGATTAVSRSTVTTVPPMAMPSAPKLQRTSTIQPGGPAGAGGMNAHVLYATKATLKINGDLDSMASNWSSEECDMGRRLVLFHKKQQGSTVSMSFRAVPENERPSTGICISCIFWKEKRECFVTSVDTIALLEQLVSPHSRFLVDEKNRIRRNLEGFRPLTVSKAKPDSAEFFKVIMGFPNPKPRNIEKDVKVFPWKILGPALKKIVAKYSAIPPDTSAIHHSTPSFHPTSAPPALLTPVSSTSPGLYAPPPYTPTMAESGYAHHDSHTTLASPRSGTGPSPTWGPYNTARTISPGLKSSPQSGGGGSARTPSLSSYAGHNYGLLSHSHRWSTNGYDDPPPYANHHHPPHPYGAGAYSASASAHHHHHHHRE